MVQNSPQDGAHDGLAQFFRWIVTGKWEIWTDRTRKSRRVWANQSFAQDRICVFKSLRAEIEIYMCDLRHLIVLIAWSSKHVSPNIIVFARNAPHKIYRE